MGAFICFLVNILVSITSPILVGFLPWPPELKCIWAFASSKMSQTGVTLAGRTLQTKSDSVSSQPAVECGPAGNANSLWIPSVFCLFVFSLAKNGISLNLAYNQSPGSVDQLEVTLHLAFWQVKVKCSGFLFSWKSVFYLKIWLFFANLCV